MTSIVSDVKSGAGYFILKHNRLSAREVKCPNPVLEFLDVGCLEYVTHNQRHLLPNIRALYFVVRAYDNFNVTYYIGRAAAVVIVRALAGK